MSETPDLSTIFFYILTRGLPNTLVLTILGLILGFVLGITLSLMSVYGGIELKWLASGYEKLLRGIPILVLIFIFRWGMPWLFWYFEDILERSLASVVLALALRSGAYQSQIFRGAILSVNPGQMDAAYALGMDRMQAARHIVLPQAFRLALPGWSNEYAVVTKDTAWAGAIGILDMVKAVDYLIFDDPIIFLPAILSVTIIYFFLTYPLTRYAGEKMSKRLRSLGLGGNYR